MITKMINELRNDVSENSILFTNLFYSPKDLFIHFNRRKKSVFQ